eukprot:TRINITY_DN2155_c0_g1_i1.p1 TRINITY_DN2155_c0_g1~~TRINITY_DN2155_c0_g1_i1.p1  ORF type:complete len:533 (-),score=142.39 TRINITY_DN2155_c0_g1_i1:919-2517(-)
MDSFTAGKHQEVVNLKRQALQLNADGQKAEALEMLRQAKILEHRLSVAATPLPTTPSPSARDAAIAISEDSTTVPTSGSVVSTVSAISAAQREQQYAYIEKELTARLQVCIDRAKHAEALGSLQNAEQWKEQEKKVRMQLQILASGRISNYEPLITYKRFVRKYDLAFPEVQSSELQLTIVRGLDFTLPAGASSLDSYINVEFPFPDSDAPQRVTSGTVKGSLTPAYNFVCKLQIQRTKALAAFIKRGKIRLELFQYRFLRSDVSLGKAEISLSELLTKCEVKEVCEFSVNRKPTGGKVEVHLHLRTPLEGRHCVEETEQVIEITGLRTDEGKVIQAPVTPKTPLTAVTGTPAASAAPAAKKPVKKPLTNAAASMAAATGGLKPAAAAKPNTTVTAKPAAAEPPAGETFLDLVAMEDDPWCIDSMVSNDVLTTIIDNLTNQLAAAPVKSEQLQGHLDNAKLKLMMLEMGVQSGKVSLEAYLDSLRRRIVEDKKIAAECARIKRIDWAKLALSRAKIMEKEVAGAEGASFDED